MARNAAHAELAGLLFMRTGSGVMSKVLL